MGCGQRAVQRGRHVPNERFLQHSQHQLHFDCSKGSACCRSRRKVIYQRVRPSRYFFTGDADLNLRRYNLEYNGSKAQGMLALAKQLLADGVPLDGIGFQGHLIVGSVPTALQAAIESFASLGLDVAITELDIRMTLPATAALYAQQKTDYQNVIKACKAVTRCVGVTVWDYTDKVRTIIM